MSEAERSQTQILAVSHACVRSANREIYRCLLRRGFSVALLVAEGIRDANGNWVAAEPLEPDDPPVFLQPTLGLHLRFMRFEKFSELLDRLDPGIVLVEADPASRVAREAAAWCSRHGRKLICRTNENLSWRAGEAVKRAGWGELPSAVVKSIMHWLVRDHVSAVCTSSQEAADLFKRLGYKRALFVPMGTDRKRFRYRSAVRSASRERLGVPASALVVAYFGRMAPEKGVETLIEALSEISELSWILLMNRFEVSSGYAKRIEKMIDAAALRERVIWAKAQHGQIAELMLASDAVVLPSRTTRKWVEQFGRVVPEAMACGNLVLVSDSGTPKELVGDSGFVFPEGDAGALAALLRRFVADPVACKSRRRKAVRHIHRRLSTEVEARIYADLVAELSR